MVLQQVRQWGAAVLWIDARPVAAFENGHVPAALPLNEDQWDRQLPMVIEVWHPDLKVVVYCDSSACKASRHVADRLRQEVGLTDVYVLHGGWAAWREGVVP